MEKELNSPCIIFCRTKNEFQQNESELKLGHKNSDSFMKREPFHDISEQLTDIKDELINNEFIYSCDKFIEIDESSNEISHNFDDVSDIEVESDEIHEFITIDKDLNDYNVFQNSVDEKRKRFYEHRKDEELSEKKGVSDPSVKASEMKDSNSYIVFKYYEDENKLGDKNKERLDDAEIKYNLKSEEYVLVIENEGEEAAPISHHGMRETLDLLNKKPILLKVSDKFTCDICGRGFDLKRSLQKHYRVHNKYFSCYVCSKQFPEMPQLTAHLRKHMEETVFSCDMCNKSFLKRGMLIRHGLRMHATARNFPCSKCDKKFPSQGLLEQHYVVHTKRLSCEFCQKKFMFKRDLTRHYSVHTKEKPFSCEVCNKSFTQKHSLMTHYLIHSNIRPFICEVCGNSFSQKDSMRRHVRVVHEKVKPFTCDVCGRCFGDKKDLDRHFRIHTAEKPYTCVVCNRAFARKDHLVKHRSVHWREDESYSCHICRETFSKNEELAQHYSLHPV